MKNITIPPNFEVTWEMQAKGSKRFGNYVIDFIVQNVVISLPMLIAMLLFYVFDYDSMLIYFTELEGIGDFMLTIVLMLLYYVTMETLTQRTVGKYVTNTMVVMEDGTKPDAGTIFKRSLCRLIPFDPFSYLGDRTRGWHDSIPNVYVVDVTEFRRALELRDSFDQIGNSDII